MRFSVGIVLSGLLSMSAGAMVVAPQRSRTLPAQDRPIAADFEDLFTIGRASGAEHELLFGLVDIAFAPDGELYLLEERNHRVEAFGPDGEFLRAFGREGQGPGEFRLPMTLALTAADEVAVWDFQNRGYAIFSRAGEYLRNVRWEDWQTGPSRDSLHPWPAGGVVYLQSVLYEDTEPIDTIDRGAIVREPLGTAGGPLELLAVHDPRQRGREVEGALVLDNGPAFAPDARWGVLSDGRLAVTDGAEYRVRLVRPGSAETELIERPIEPRATSEADREHERERVRALYENASGATMGGGSGGGGNNARERFAREVADSLEFADVIPVIKDLRVDFDDRLWIQRQGAVAGDDGPIDLVSVAGKYLGTLPAMPLPDAFGPDGMVAWMENGRDVEVERVVVRRLPPGLR
jgi:hypothetical protein